MSEEIFLIGYPSGATTYALVRNSSGQIWNPTLEAFEDFGTGSRSHADYDIPLTDKSGGMYVADFPSAIPANTTVGYRTISYRQIGSSPASTDHVVGGARIYWTGSAEAAADTELNATSVVNRAYYKLGGARTRIVIDDIDDATDSNAVIAAVLYPQVRNEVLQRWPWNECREFADLGAAVTGLEMADWDYAFALPTNCISVVAQIDEENHTAKYTYEVRGGYLFTRDYSNADGDSVYIDYVKKVVDASVYSPLLFEAIATKLAAELAPVYNPDRKEELKREFELLVLPNAEAANQGEQHSEDEGEYKWRNARTS
jgi:hypothetical protein